jgi:hypothetical protein
MQFVYIMGSYECDPEKFNCLLYRDEPHRAPGKRLPMLLWDILPPFSNLKIEAVCSSEMFVITYQTTRCHNPEDDNVYLHQNETL